MYKYINNFEYMYNIDVFYSIISIYLYLYLLSIIYLIIFKQNQEKISSLSNTNTQLNFKSIEKVKLIDGGQMKEDFFGWR